jgi:hypothetical protein
MRQFIAKFRHQITRVISGFDRLIFRGVLRRLVYSQGMEQYLWQNQILFKDYACHVKKVSQRIKNARIQAGIWVSPTERTRGVPALTQNG